ncbi:MAG TPA: DUF4097 family beta strand repeat-containing protein [Acidimicrobiales bacterium]|nr:DUF4097 family beta strand repeat-containing protein [Acidimicrobiales bacterium]
MLLRQAYLASRASDADYRRRRRETLNFETIGGERAALVERTPVAQSVGANVVVTSRRYVVAERTREEVMGKDRNSRRAARVARPTPSYDHERREQYEASGPLSVVITTRSGDVNVRASDANEVTVVLGTNRAGAEASLARARVDFDEGRRTLEIETTPLPSGRPATGLRAAMRSDWFSSGVGDLNVVVTLPEGSDLQVSTVSGDTTVAVALGDVKVSSASGDVVATDTLTSFDVRTASGDVSADRVLTRVRCKSASGDVVLGGAAAKTDIVSASGDVVVTTTDPGVLSVNVASGDVTVLVATGLVVDVTGNTVSGRLGSEIDLSGVSGNDSSKGVSFIKVNTISGDILIDRTR